MSFSTFRGPLNGAAMLMEYTSSGYRFIIYFVKGAQFLIHLHLPTKGNATNYDM